MKSNGQFCQDGLAGIAQVWLVQELASRHVILRANCNMSL